MIKHKFQFVEKMFADMPEADKDEMHTTALSLLEETAKFLFWELQATKAENFYCVTFNSDHIPGEEDTHHYLTFQKAKGLTPVQKINQLQEALASKDEQIEKLDDAVDRLLAELSLLRTELEKVVTD